MNLKVLARAFSAIVLVAGLAACSSMKKNQFADSDSAYKDLSLGLRSTGVPLKTEKKMAARLMAEVNRDFPPVSDPAVQNYLNQLGRSLLANSASPGHPYDFTFTLVESKQVNAFSIPGGAVYITAPMLAEMRNEAELAGVLAHQIGHIKARHGAEKLQTEINDGTLGAAGGGLVSGGALGSAPGQRPQGERYKFLINSLQSEMEADVIGLQAAVLSGYDKKHVGAFYEKLLRMKETKSRGPAYAEALRQHPPSPQRAAQINEFEESPGGKPRITSVEFENARKRIKDHLKNKKGQDASSVAGS